MILMPQIFDVTANENACYKRNELEFSITCTVRSVTCLVDLRYSYGTFTIQYSSREPWAAAASTFTNGRPTDKGFWQIFYPLDIRSRYLVRLDWGIHNSECNEHKEPSGFILIKQTNTCIIECSESI